MRDHARAVLLHALKGVAKVVARLIDGVAEEPLQPIPGSEDLRQVLFSHHAPISIESAAFLDLNAEVTRARAALLKRFQQFRMGGDPRAAANEFDRGALVDVGVPSLLPQERRGEEPGYRA